MKNKTEILDGKFSVKADTPTYDVIEKDGVIIDYQNVRVDGYANTFNIDRGGEQVIPGAFGQHLEEFMANPVLLVDHERNTAFAAGQVHTAHEDETGLKVTATLSNSPSEKMRDIRFKVAEGVLRTFSIGGMFHAKALGEKLIIHKVELREISIVTVPMNKESLFEVKQDDGKRNVKKSVPEKMESDDLQEGHNPELYVIDKKGNKRIFTEEQYNGK